MSTNITPLHDRVIVRRIEEGEQGSWGNNHPRYGQGEAQEGEIVAAGQANTRERWHKTKPLDVKKGDRVLFGKYSGSESRLTVKSC